LECGDLPPLSITPSARLTHIPRVLKSEGKPSHSKGSIMAKKKPAQKNGPAAVESIRHKDKRKNIPTEELRDFVAEEEKAPKTMLYPRDPSLDPQLVWKGKDEQDREDLAVPVVPIYIQDKIHPRAIINDLLSAGQRRDPQLEMFADFNGLPEEFDQRVDFYHHEGNWSNRMILGDSLLVMTSLAEKEGLKGKVQCIYFDPPYGIKFGSNWQVSTRKRDVKDGKAEDATRQPEQVRAFRDTWQCGIHSYLAYLRDRLVVARELLTETGSVFVQINSENSHLMRNLLDEVFGSENFIADIYFRKKSIPLGARYLETMHDQILFYAKASESVKFRHLYEEMDAAMLASHGPYALYPDGKTEKTKVELVFSPSHPKGTRYYRLFSLLAPSYAANTVYEFEFEGRTFAPPSRGSWVVNKEKLSILASLDRLQPEGENLSYRLFYDDFPYRKRTNTWTDAPVSYEKTYVVQTSPEVVARCLLMTTDPGDLVLDPTCGSGTTAYVAEQWGRRWITTDTSRVALALARTRLMAAKYPFYLLSDSPAGRKKSLECGGSPPLSNTAESASDDTPRVLKSEGKPSHSKDEADIRQGFVYKRVPHVTLKSIANNPDIKEGMTRAEIDAAIARHAESETLFDQPYEDKKTVRVTGPLTVESLSPHRTISVEQKKERSEVGRDGLKIKVIGPDGFATMILDNLRKAGVQNTVKGERLIFDSLDPFAGEWIHAQGHYSEKEGTQRRAAICIGPEHGTVGALLIKEAAKEAVRGVGFDVLLVCGFAFDPSVSEETKRYGKLTVLPVRMNPDLAMGDELLKKTGAGNLFMVFGEPDVDIAKQADGKITVVIKGLDVYDPTTGQIRNSSTDDIACWFIDTAYNDESFFVRHAYFTGADEPYEKLKRALRAEIDEGAWSALYSTTSRPFDPPETGKIAVKVINHYGDEVLKVFDVAD
jgi:adenine-specific DNA-methyltransferase